MPRTLRPVSFLCLLPLRVLCLALRPSLLAVGVLAGALLSGCSLFGSKGDPTTDEIFEQGQTDPTLPSEVGYVPLNPFYDQGLDGALDAPTDVYVGWDEFIYVADRAGLHVLDLAGRPRALLENIGYDTNGDGVMDEFDADVQPLRNIEAIVQDRRLHVYIAARRDTTIAGLPAGSCARGETCDLPVIYRVSGLTTGNPRVEDIIWHPFDDDSRRLSRYNLPGRFGSSTDEDVRFTGVATLADNRLYVTRSGPVNSTETGRPNQSFSPFNAFLIYTNTGQYVQYVRALAPDRPSLLSAYWPSDVATFIGPPQRAQVDPTENFLMALAPPDGQPGAPYGVVSVRVVQTSDGTDYQVDATRLGAVATIPEAGDGALFEEGQFRRVSSLAVAPDVTGYTFVLDAGHDSLFVFNRQGIEGVAPPPGSGSTRPVRVSFGGTGAGPLQFNNPQGVAYFERTVYVADTGNNRISRFRLNTDFE